MKLVDILARELKAWPEDGESIEQDRHGSCLFKVGGPAISTHVEDIADDAETAKVTRAEWQAAVNALNAPKVVEWDGVGLPPVGAVCAVLNSALCNPTWERCTILYSGKHRVMYDSESCEERVAFIENLEFRKARTILTAEQVAAEEWDKARTEVLNAMTENGKTASEPEALWKFRLKVVGEMLDMGYRKEPKPCGS